MEPCGLRSMPGVARCLRVGFLPLDLRVLIEREGAHPHVGDRVLGDARTEPTKPAACSKFASTILSPCAAGGYSAEAGQEIHGGLDRRCASPAFARAGSSRRPPSLSSGHASRGPGGGLLRMRNFLNAIMPYPHPEEHPKGCVSKDASPLCSSSSNSCPASQHSRHPFRGLHRRVYPRLPLDLTRPTRPRCGTALNRAHTRRAMRAPSAGATSPRATAARTAASASRASSAVRNGTRSIPRRSAGSWPEAAAILAPRAAATDEACDRADPTTPPRSVAGRTRRFGLGCRVDGGADCPSFPSRTARARRVREARRDQDQVIEIPRFEIQETGDNRKDRADRQRFPASTGLQGQRGQHVGSLHVPLKDRSMASRANAASHPQLICAAKRVPYFVGAKGELCYISPIASIGVPSWLRRHANRRRRQRPRARLSMTQVSAWPTRSDYQTGKCNLWPVPLKRISSRRNNRLSPPKKQSGGGGKNIRRQ